MRTPIDAVRTVLLTDSPDFRLHFVETPNDRGSAAAAQDRTSRRRLQPLVSRRVSRYSDYMKVAIELPSGQAAQLETEAKRLGVSVEDLARAAVTDLLAAPDAAFQASAKRILAQNLELYRRLA